MPTYKAPVEDTLFLLNDVFGINRYSNLPGFADISDMLEPILAEGAKVCEESWAPL
ncbi:MAG: acyl-CoA dehydrogenase N-terminal domain-containing protein, partial [Beijerinckiaceae bacterium]